MKTESRAEVIHRLKSAAGHVNGIIHMLEEDRTCIEVIQQIQATQIALQRVSENLLDEHLQTCVMAAIQDSNHHEREQLLAEIVEIYRQTNRLHLNQGEDSHEEQDLQDS